MIRTLILLLLPLQAQAFPEMIRHGYINCTACHVSPSGGGLMTTYGRSISKEVLSRWGYEGEENFLHGAIKPEKGLEWINGSRDVGFNIGGDLRFAQTHRESDTVKEGRFIRMQRDIEAAFKVHKLIAVAAYGIQLKRNEDEADLRRAYLMYQVLESLSVRAGRFIPVYGLNLPDHIVSVRRGLGLDQGSDREVAELNYIWENWNATLSYSETPHSRPEAQIEKAVALQVNYAFLDKHKVGINYFTADSDVREREMYGIHGMWGFTPDFYALSEFDIQKQKTLSTGATADGIYYFQKFGYEFTRGIHAIAQIDGSQSDRDLDMSKTFAYGLGFNFYPRPHFDFTGLWTKATIKAVQPGEMDVAYFMMHYYF